MELFWNTTRRQLVESFTDETIVPEVKLVQGDYETISVALLEETGDADAPFAILALPAGHSLILGAKLNFEDETYCVRAASFVQAGSGDSVRHSQDVDLDTAECDTALGVEDVVFLHAELALVSAAGKHVWTTAFWLRLEKKVVAP